MRQDMVKEMKNDFEEDRKKLKQVYLVRFLMTAAMLLLLIFNFDHWMNVIVNFLLVIFCSFISFKLLAIFSLFVNFPGDPARLSGRGRAKGV